MNSIREKQNNRKWDFFKLYFQGTFGNKKCVVLRKFCIQENIVKMDHLNALEGTYLHTYFTK